MGLSQIPDNSSCTRISGMTTSGGIFVQYIEWFPVSHSFYFLQFSFPPSRQPIPDTVIPDGLVCRPDV
jgi:hypothetical protein